MEKGYFQKSIENDFQVNEEIASKIPTPNQIPQPPDLSKVPEKMLKSGVIENLINQNDDLMARLTVSLRRISFLEDKVTESEKRSLYYQNEYENLNDQVLILKEKTKSVSSRYEHKDQEISRLKKQVQFLETKYATLYKHSSEKNKNLTLENSQLKHTLRAFYKFRNKFRLIKRNIRKRNANNQLKISQLISHVERLNNDLEARDINISDLRKNITESTEYIQNINKINNDKEKQIIAQYETQISQLKNEMADLLNRNEILTSKEKQLMNTLDEKIKMENEIILLQRKQEEYRIKTQAEIADIQKDLMRYRNASKSQALELDSLKTEHSQLSSTHSKTLAEHKELNEQVESLQCLWKESQEKIEKHQQKNISLQKLNQQLSIQLNRFRKENHELKQKIDTVHLSTKEQLKKVRGEFKTIVAIQKDKDSDTQKAQNKKTHEDFIKKIDSLLAEIHTGYSQEKKTKKYPQSD